METLRVFSCSAKRPSSARNRLVLYDYLADLLAFIHLVGDFSFLAR